MTNKNEELWIKQLKKTLENRHEPLPFDGWESLAEELTAPAKKQIYPRYYKVVAAVALLLTASIITLFFLRTPLADETKQTPSSTLTSNPGSIPSMEEPRQLVAQVTPLPAITRTTSPTKGNPPEIKENTKEQNTTITNNTQQVHKEKDTRKAKDKTIPRTSKTTDKPYQYKQTTASPKNKWTIRASMSNASSRTAKAEVKIAGKPFLNRIDMLGASEESMIDISSDKKLVFEDGIPYIKEETETVDINHHQPITFGLTVRKNMTKNYSIESGLTYTLLASDIKKSGSTTAEKQKLHYIGIPLRINRDMLNTPYFTLYLSAGGMVEKCVSGKLGNQTQKVNPLQWSLSGAGGARYNITPKMGIYLEPGISYFFDDGSEVQTIRKEKTLNVTIQAGVQISF